MTNSYNGEVIAGLNGLLSAASALSLTTLR